jgi:SAM-dependent methyltransferase
MSGFYRSIAPFYDDIFPYNPHQKDFVLTSAEDQPKNKSLMDVGCGTGNLALELSKYFDSVTGIDSDREMIGAARAKASEAGSEAVFECLDMLNIGRCFKYSPFDIITCFGNTLVHLENAVEIGDFIEQTKRLLNPGGKLLVQIVQYDRIITRNIRQLPLIENDRVRFERFYHPSPETDKIEFHTVLRIRDSDRVIKNKIELCPILKDELEKILKDSGFDHIRLYGSFKREPLSDNSVPLIIEASNNKIGV